MKNIYVSISCCIVALFLFSFFPGKATCVETNKVSVPEVLTDWKGWVLHGKETALCPTSYNNGEKVTCRWPSRLTLRLHENGGRFEQSWLMFSEGWVSLPGSREAWPQFISRNNTPVVVMDRDASPRIRLPAGEHHVTGRFAWQKMPEMIPVPPAVGLVSLHINDRPVELPEIDEEGRLWLQQRKGAAKREDRLTLRLYRMINDTIPMQVTTRIRLNVSGRPREEQLGKILLDDAVALRLDSALPAKLTPGGNLVCQVRPGKWQLSLKTRLPGQVTQLQCNSAHGSEIWSFQAQNQLRMVEITGATSVEPSRTDMPEKWKRLPAYELSPGNSLTFKELRRGDPDPAPDRINLVRALWLDFNGKGYTVQDTITGTMSRQWYLAMTPPGKLGRAAIDGKNQLITRQGEKNLPGVALRRGKLHLVADSRLSENTGEIPAVGWEHDFESVSGILHLPPGWRLLGAVGVDTISGTWIQRWTLLDFFMVLIIGLSVMKLRNLKWGVVALITMILIFHEPGAPRLVWLNLIAVSALLNVLPGGWLKKGIKLWGLVAVVTLLVLAIPFMVQQIRWGVFPQLSPAGSGQSPSLRRANLGPAAPMMTAQVAPEEDMVGGSMEYKPRKKPKAYRKSMAKQEDRQKQAVFAADPNALIQTGPGLPTWQWRTFRLTWNGPVARSQSVRLWLASPTVNLILGILRTVLLAMLIVGGLNIRSWLQKTKEMLPRPETIAVATLFFLFLSGSLQDLHAEFPSQELLKTLQQRLLEKPDCLPHCANVPQMAVSVDSQYLKIMLRIHAATRTAVPLPATRSSWSPTKVIMDQAPLTGLSRDDTGMLWALIPEGVHTVTLIGKTTGDVLQIPLPIIPHSASIQSKGWTVLGIHPDGSADASIRMTRIQPTTLSTPTGKQPLPSFFHIRRTFHLGLTWQITTSVRRMTPAGVPATLFFPLLANESITTPGIHIEKNTAQIVMPPGSNFLHFESSLAKTETIELTAPVASPWTESWVLDASAIWQCDFYGIPVIHHQGKEGQWQPEWSPWPGETVKIMVSRPNAIPGKMITIDNARLDWTPGLRFNKAELKLTLRTSRGGRHDITLPASATLQDVKINGQSLPVQQTETRLTVPLQPGAQEVHAVWHQPGISRSFMRSPKISVGDNAVNARVSFHMPRNRWILMTGGPRLGPAVLFWSYLAVVMLAAFGLMRVKIMPLKAHQWVLLGLGLTQVPAITALVIVGWFLALGIRGEKIPPDKWLPFNGTQLLLVILTLAAMTGLYNAVERGLLGVPDMQIAGNNSSRYVLYWTQDRIASEMPRPWALSVPLWAYRVLMLLWSLWLAFSLLKWLQWAWRCFSTGKLWKKAAPRRKQKKAAVSSEKRQTEP